MNNNFICIEMSIQKQLLHINTKKHHTDLTIINETESMRSIKNSKLC